MEVKNTVPNSSSELTVAGGVEITGTKLRVALGVVEKTESNLREAGQVESRVTRVQQ